MAAKKPPMPVPGKGKGKPPYPPIPAAKKPAKGK